ncbi:MAG: hypothetical protein HKN41_09010 [Ilumatobacter sp.]|nr:hypothetical protein [Ilumatobacter sp.]
MSEHTRPRGSDEGSVLILVLILFVVLGLVVAALATYAVTTLRFGGVVEGRADRLSAAEGGMRDVAERLAEDGSLCTTALGSAPGGVDLNVLPDINDADVYVNCQAINGNLSSVSGWAVVVTGEGGVPNERGLETQSGTGVTKVFGGPTYVAELDLVRIQADLEIRAGNLWYTDPACDEGGEYVSDGSGVGTGGGDLTFDPTSRGVWCTDRSWAELFSRPDPPVGLGSLPTLVDAPRSVAQPDGAYEDLGPGGACRVFYPGRYFFHPDWAANNYMLSGDYYFNVGATPAAGKITIDHAIVTAGREGVAGDQQEIDNSPCNDFRDADVAEGASFYLDGATHFSVEELGGLEILRRRQGDDFVSMQALDTHVLGQGAYDNTTHGSGGDSVPDILSTASGNQKQMALHGMIWAPFGTLDFGEVTSTAAAQLLGGAVVAALRADASASASGFVIQVLGSPDSDKYRLTAVATKDGRVTRVRVIADLRFSPPTMGGGVGFWELAMNSWRVCEPSGC